MANGSEQGEIVVSSIRTGMKREFAAMMKAQAGRGIGIVGQGRVTRSQLNQNPSNSPSSSNANGNGKSSMKKRKKEAKNGEDLVNSKVELVESNGVVKKEEKSLICYVKKQKKEVKNRIVAEDLSNSKEELVSNGVMKKEENVVLLSDDSSDSKGVGKELESNGKTEENVVLLSDDSLDTKGVGEELESKGEKEENVVSLLSEEEEPKSDVVDCNSSDDEKKSKMDDEDVVGSQENKENADMQSCGDDTKIGMDETANGNDGVVEAMPEIVPELAVTEQGDSKKEQNCGENIRTEIAKPVNDNSDIVEGISEIVPEFDVTDQGDGKTEIAETVKANDGLVEVMPEIVPELGVTAKAVYETPMRRFTRSALKAKEDAKVVSECASIKIEEVFETVSVEPTSAPAKLELKMSKKVALTKIPTKLKDLLETGLLEGLPVRYIRCMKVKGHPDTGLRGEIRGLGILCFCNNCNGTSVVTPAQFELHAGSANKRPPEYIYLENGRSLRDVLSMCKYTPSDELEVAIKKAIGSADAKLFASESTTTRESISTPAQNIEASSRSASSVPVTKSTERMPSGSGTQSKLQGKLTRKDIRMHKLVFEEGGLPDGTELAYYVRGQKLLEGYKKGHGIFCYCCNSEVSPSQFEAHAGCASRRKPYLYIYTSNGVSLHELSIKLSLERRSSAEENDDLCSICADGGDLLCCDNCPRAFHTECVSLPSIPMGTWYCKYCENMFAKERFVEFNANAIAAGRVAGIDAIEQITKRCIRMVEALDSEVSVCVLCRSQDFSKSGFDLRTVIICDQCEKEYHVGCLKEHNMDDLQELPKDKWFCCTDCSRIHSTLENLVSEGEQKMSESLLKVLKEKHERKDPENDSTLDIKWRLLSGKMSSEETRVWLSGAVSIFHDQFDPIADASTSRLDLIPHLVYGRNFKDQDFGGMFCAILSVNSLVVSAGIIRIFGKEVAELPLVATSSNCQGQGYFQSLFSCIENLLQSLNVENLVLPSAPEAESIWTNRFGFKKISEEQLKHYRKNYQMMIFSGTSMLQKQVGGS